MHIEPIVSIDLKIHVFFMMNPQPNYLFNEKENYEEIPPPLHIIYFIFVKEPKWRIIVKGQCNDILKSKIPARVTVVLSSPDNLLDESTRYVDEQFEAYPYGYQRVTQSKNQFEYPGLSHLHTVAPDIIRRYLVSVHAFQGYGISSIYTGPIQR